MDIRELLIDGIEQLNDWMDDALKGLTAEQVNFLPDGKTTSIGFNAWHVLRTQDNIVNFVFQRKNTAWMEGGYVEKFGLPKVEQGTGMGLEDARSLTINDPELMRQYLRDVRKDTIAFLKAVDPAVLEEVQAIRPLGEMPKWKVCRQVLMTHGFMHLGEMNLIRGILGLQFMI